jgi:hypothetical protein
MVTFPGNEVYKSIHHDIGTPDTYTPAVVGVPRFGPVGNRGETSSGNGQRSLINGKGDNVGNLIKVPYYRSIHIDIPVFVDDNDVRLR